ncbi:nitroreductase [bacterium]|nr:nitroreductase [bacterium]
MELKDAVRQRRSIRKFLSKPVPEETIKEIITDSLWAPSWGNTQPWEIVIVTGDPLEQYRKENTEAHMSGKTPNPDITVPSVWPDLLTKRYKDVGRSVLGSLSIERGDTEGRIKYYGEMASLFGATALIMLVVDKDISLEYAILDAGLIIQNICLFAQDKGLGTCIMAATINFPDIARRLFSIPDSKRIVIGTALGWPDLDAPVNQFQRERGSLDEFVTWAK